MRTAASALCALFLAISTPAWSTPAQAPLSEDARVVLQWIVESADHQRRPFVVVDKKRAQLHAFDGQARWQGSTPVLIGLAPGDHSVPGVGDKDPAQLLPSERTTPAGRFESEPGYNLQGEDVVWFDYDAGLAIHRVRPGRSQETRLQRLASTEPRERRVSLGCVVVPVPFYDAQLVPLLGRRRGVVYVLPETKPVQAMFGSTLQVGQLSLTGR